MIFVRIPRSIGKRKRKRKKQQYFGEYSNKFIRKTKTKADKTVFVRILRSINRRKRKRKQTK